MKMAQKRRPQSKPLREGFSKGTSKPNSGSGRQAPPPPPPKPKK